MFTGGVTGILPHGQLSTKPAVPQDFGDGTGVWPILRGESEWELRGTRFKGDPAPCL